MSLPQIVHNANNPNYTLIIQNTPICQLPVEQFFRVLKYLDPDTVNKVCSLLCRQFKIILSLPTYNRIWRDLFCSHFPNKNINEIKKFDLSYKSELIISSNIKNGVYTSCKYINQSYTCFVADGHGRLLGTQLNDHLEGSVEIWDPLSSEQVKIIPVNNDLNDRSELTAVTASHTRLYVGTYQGDIEILDIETGKSLNILQEHGPQVDLLAIVDKNLVAKYSDGTIKIFSLEEIETPRDEYGALVLQDAEKHQVDSSLITFNGKYLLGINFEEISDWALPMIVIKDLWSQEVIATIKIHEKVRITSLAYDNERLYAALSNGKIEVYDLKSYEHITTLVTDISLASDNDRLSLAVVDGNLYVSDSQCVIKFDFTKSYEVVLKEIADHLKTTNPSEAMILDAMKRFSRMPQSAKNHIYEELYRLLKPENHYWGWGEDSFHNQNTQFSSPVKKGEAIENYLISFSDEEEVYLGEGFNLPIVHHEEADFSFVYHEEVYPPSLVYPLLQCLKIEIEQDYSKQLGCRPEHLQERGIFTLKDLNVICPCSLDIEEISIDLSSANANPDFMEQQVIVNRNRMGLSTLANQMLNAITNMDQEAKNCGEVIYEGNEPWIQLQQQLNQFNNQFNAIVEKCGRKPRAIIQAFTGNAYIELAQQLNHLIKEFHEVDIKHRIVKLHAYIHQKLILQVWTVGLKNQNQAILTLSDFQAKYGCSLRQLLHMEEFVEKNM